jgi:hypothetical protein
LDFLGGWPLPCENPRFWVFDFLGFPWILSFESSLFNGLRGKSAENIFRTPALALRGAGTGAHGRGNAEVQDCSWGELTLVSDFLQDIAVKAAPRRLNPKAARSKVQSPSAAQVELRR